MHPLRVARMQLKLSQAEIARIIGVSIRQVVRWEQGKCTPHPGHRKRLTEALDRTAEELGLSKYMEKQPLLDLASKIATQANNLKSDVHTFACTPEEEQKNVVLANISVLLNLTNDLIDIVGAKELKEYNALFQSWQQGRDK